MTIAPSTLLPKRAAELLREAAEAPETHPLARRKAVDQAIERVKRDYPQYFNQECEDGTGTGGSRSQ